MAHGVLLVSGNHTHQEMYGRAFAADARCHVVGVTDEPGVPRRRQEHNAAFARELGVPLLDDLDAALARDDVQVVSVCAEPERRARVVKRCIDAGKHVYVDKAPATNLEEARHVEAAAGEAGLLSQVFSLVRGATAQRARAVVESGELGTLTGFHCEMTFAKGLAGTADLSRPRVEKPAHDRWTWTDSKRELFCVGWYPLILFQWLTGARFESVQGATSNFFFEAHQRNDADDFACMTYSASGGIEATITVGRTGWASHPDFGVHQVHLVGTDGAVTLDEWSPRLETYSDAEPWTPPETPHPEDPMGFWGSTQQEGGVRPKRKWWPIRAAADSDAAAFLDALEAGRPSDVPLSMGVHALEAILAGYEAAAERSTVRLA